jgi:signal recognition particle subunit SRP54
LYIYRPAAIQLYVVGDSIGVEVYSEPENKNPVEIAQKMQAKRKYCYC